MSIWFTSDTHYGHENVIRFCNRPFVDSVHMENALVGAHNAVVKPDDIVYHLGDFIWSPKAAEWDRILDQLHGRFRVIRGNHDLPLRRGMFGHRKIDWVRDFSEEKIDGIKVVLCHYPIASWNGARKGSFHLHGHCHSSMDHLPGRLLDVGVDCWGYKPVSWTQVRETLEAIEPLDQRELVREEAQRIGGNG